MSLYIFIAIIILLIIGIFYTWYLHGKNESDIKTLQSEITEVDTSEIENKIIRLTDYKFTGVSLETYKNEITKFNEAKSKDFNEILSNLEELIVQNSNYKVFSVHKLIRQQKNNLNEVNQKLQDIFDTLNKLSESGQNNANRVDELKKTYLELRKEILSKSYIYGPSTDNLKRKLTDLEDLFTQEQDLTDNGDHLEAQNMLSNIQKEIDKLQDSLNQIKPLYKELSEVFPGQLEEINDIYQNLREKYVSFSEPDIEESVEHITSAISGSKYKLAVLDFESVAIDNKSIAIEIDQVYERIEIEINAREKVLDQKSELKDFIGHAEVQNELLRKELRDIEDSYILVNGEMDKAVSLKGQIESISNHFNDYSLKFDRAPVIYSEVLNIFINIKEELTNIEIEQKSIHEEISDMFNSEKVARVSVNKFKNDIKRQKRELEQMRLNGLPQDYIDYFNMVDSELGQLENQLNEPRINVEEISKQLIIVQEDSENLSQKTNELIKNVKLVQNVIQYSNRYIATNENIKEASRKAFDLYENEYNYKKALDVISGALEQVDPGAIQRLQDSLDA